MQMVHTAITTQRNNTMETILGTFITIDFLFLLLLLGSMLQSIRHGLLENTSVELPDLLIIIFNLTREYILVDRKGTNIHFGKYSLVNNICR